MSVTLYALGHLNIRLRRRHVCLPSITQNISPMIICIGTPVKRLKNNSINTKTAAIKYNEFSIKKKEVTNTSENTKNIPF